MELAASWVSMQLSKSIQTCKAVMKVASGSQMELDSPTKLVLCFQASMPHPMRAGNPHAFMQLLALIFHFFCYINWWSRVSFHCSDFVRQLTPFCMPTWVVMLCSCSTSFCVPSKPRTRMIPTLRCIIPSLAVNSHHQLFQSVTPQCSFTHS